MRFAIALLALVVATLAAVLAWQISRSRDLERSLKAARVTTNEEMAAETLQLQGKCAAQAKIEFASMGLASNEMAGYESHYNPQFKRCFVAILHTDAKTHPHVIWTWRYVRDAFERKDYGTYAWHTVEGKKYWEVPPFQCEVTLPSGEKRTCKSDDEFTELVGTYMGGPLAKPRSN